MSHTEMWKPVPGWADRYEASTSGKLRSIRREGRSFGRTGVVHKGCVYNTGHIRVSLRKPGTRLEIGLHRLILLTFIGPCPPGQECLHTNGDPADNRLENLRWGTRSENLLDAVRHGTHHNTAKKTCIRGHKLSEPNLVKSAQANGSRACLACSRARASLQKRPGDIQTRADEKYEQIMAHAINEAVS